LHQHQQKENNMSGQKPLEEGTMAPTKPVRPKKD
jgi:hypothetical protein